MRKLCHNFEKVDRYSKNTQRGRINRSVMADRLRNRRIKKRLIKAAGLNEQNPKDTLAICNLLGE